MVDVTFYGSCIGFTALAPMCAGRKQLNYYSPLTYQVHKWALNCQHGEERYVQLLHYFAKPADRVIQAVVAPIFEMFQAYGLFKDCITIGLTSKDYSIKAISALCLALSPVITPAMLIYGLAQSVLFFLNGTLQVVLPYQAFYAIYKGKEAAKEYFEVREKYEEKTETQHLPKCFVWKNPPNIEKPISSINAYHDMKPLVDIEKAAELQTRLSEKEFTAVQLIMHPGASLWIIRMILMT